MGNDEKDNYNNINNFDANDSCDNFYWTYR